VDTTITIPQQVAFSNAVSVMSISRIKGNPKRSVSSWLSRCISAVSKLGFLPPGSKNSTFFSYENLSLRTGQPSLHGQNPLRSDLALFPSLGKAVDQAAEGWTARDATGGGQLNPATTAWATHVGRFLDPRHQQVVLQLGLTKAHLRAIRRGVTWMKDCEVRDQLSEGRREQKHRQDRGATGL